MWNCLHSAKLKMTLEQLQSSKEETFSTIFTPDVNFLTNRDSMYSIMQMIKTLELFINLLTRSSYQFLHHPVKASQIS